MISWNWYTFEALTTLQLYEVLAYPSVPMLIMAQLYLQNFYEGFGFKVDGEAYDDEGIMHIDMLLTE